MKIMKNYLFLWLLLLSPLLSESQTPIALYDKTRVYREALELFDHEKYVPAKEKFEEYIKLEKDPQHALRINSEYYSGICALYLLHKDAEYQLEKFVLEHPDSPWKQRAYFELATFNYQKKAYDKALEWFEFVDERELSKAEKIEFRYKRGHSRFERGDMTNARLDFFEAKQEESEYKLASIYYYSHIAYEQNDYQTALEGFLLLENDPLFKPLIPYYITQIYYKQKKYDEVLRYGPAALAQAEANATKRAPEIARLIGDSYCIKEKYAEALPFLEQYHTATPKSDITREDYYQLGYAYHRTSQWQKAIDAYANCNDENDELHQRGSYNMGECYLKLQQKEYARNAFEEASEMDFNKEIQEDAMFNYAKLAFELSYNPFHEAITAFEDYLSKYPESKRRDEAYEFLLNVYMKTRNYEKALTSLDKIKNKDNRVKEAYQVVAYNRGVELFQAEDFVNAEKNFDKVPTYPVNPTLNADARFWKSEISYRQQDYSKAVQRYTAFIAEPGSYASEFYGLSHYSQGYAYFKMANAEDNYDVANGLYANANTSFRKYVDGAHTKDPKKINDAYMRIGDCFFVNKSYSQAISYYDKAATGDQAGKEYAMFQKAMSYGYDGQNDKKAWVLKSLLTESPDSKFEIDAKYEIAKTYLLDNRLGDAKTYYNDILKNHAASQYAKLALKDMCLIYVKEGNDAKVKESWTEIKNKYKNDPVVCDAYAICKSVLIEDPEFQNDAVTICGASKDDVEQDVYAKAVGYAQSDDCVTAITKLTDYLNRFQPAYYGLDANYYLANCHFEKGNMDKALESYNYVIAQGSSNYLEECLVVAATISYNKKDYSQALSHYKDLEQIAVLKNNVLEAQIGLMRCYYQLDELADAKIYADLVIGNASTPDEIRTTAHLWRGRIQKQNDQYDAAISDFKEVIKKGGSAAAEAKYGIAFCLYSKGEYKKAEPEIFQLIEKYSAFEEWKFRGFLLLADTYIGLKDYFQARATVNAILENVSEQWVIDEANQKKAQLDALENPTGTGNSNSDIEIDLQPNNN